MYRIGGNTPAMFERATTTKNSIGEDVQTWEPVGSLTGWLDPQTGGVGYTAYNAPIVEASHVFLADYNATIAAASAETCRAVIGGKRYDVLLIDDPMGLHEQLEVYLKYTGGQ